MKVLRKLTVFLRRKDRGQDVAEYCLITALFSLICLGIFMYVSGGIDGMWTSINSSLATANNASQPGAGPGQGGH